MVLFCIPSYLSRRKQALIAVIRIYNGGKKT